MTKTIARLWNGTLDPAKYSGADNSELKQLEQLIQRNGESLEESIDKKAEEIFEKYIDCVNEYIVLCNEQAFCDGFSLGAKIITEALLSAEQII